MARRRRYHELEIEADKRAFRQRAFGSYVWPPASDDPGDLVGYAYADWEGMLRAKETLGFSLFWPRLARWLFGP